VAAARFSELQAAHYWGVPLPWWDRMSQEDRAEMIAYMDAVRRMEAWEVDRANKRKHRTKTY